MNNEKRTDYDEFLRLLEETIEDILDGLFALIPLMMYCVGALFLKIE